MGDKSAIEWTDATWNPVAGCNPISAGCDHCYALELHNRRHQAWKDGWSAAPAQYHQPFEGGVQLLPERLGLPLRWRTPRRIFVNSMSDLFHVDVPDSFVRRVFGVISLAGRHTFQILTKRPTRMAAFFARAENSLAACQAEALVQGDLGTHAKDLAAINGTGGGWPLPNVWLGTSVENQDAADKRIPALRSTPAILRFLSCEPLLGSVALSRLWVGTPCWRCGNTDGEVGRCYCGVQIKPEIHLVIAGGESGKNARSMNPDWVRDLRDDCQDAGVAFFFKQWGEWLPFFRSRVDGEGRYIAADGRRVSVDDLMAHAHEIHEDHGIIRLGKKVTGRLLDGREHNDLP